MRRLLAKFLCLAGRHHWVVHLQFGRPAILCCRECALVKEVRV